MRIIPIIAAFLLSGCAFSESAGEKDQPCVKQDRCVIGCTVSNNQCGKEEKADGTR